MAKRLRNPLPTTVGFAKILILWFNWSLFPVDVTGLNSVTKLEEGRETDKADCLIRSTATIHRVSGKI